MRGKHSASRGVGALVPAHPRSADLRRTPVNSPNKPLRRRILRGGESDLARPLRRPLQIHPSIFNYRQIWLFVPRAILCPETAAMARKLGDTPLERQDAWAPRELTPR